MAKKEDVDYFLKQSGIDSEREKIIGQHIGYRYDVNLLPDYSRLTPFLKDYIAHMGWEDLNWLEDVHSEMKLPDNQQDRDMLARELLVKFQMSPSHPLVQLNKAYRKF